MEEKRRFRRGGWQETQNYPSWSLLARVLGHSEAGISKTLYRKRLKQASSLTVVPALTVLSS